MSNKNLFKDAIVDARAIREAALLNAKEALEEALTPSIQNMLVAKLNEMDMSEYGEEEDTIKSELDEEDFMRPNDSSDEWQDAYDQEQGKPGIHDLEEDFDLSEILAELEAEEKLDEAKKGEEEEEETEEEETEEDAEETEEEEMEVSEMSVEDLKNLIKDIVSQELEAEEAETPADEEAEMDMMNMGGEEIHNDEEEINLEELLAELDSLDGGLNEYEKPDDMLQAICYDYPEHASCKGLKEARKIQKIKSKPVTTNKDKEEMKEAINVINILRKELNETNLLNAKLLYVNKIFKSKNLSESQKLNVIASFDRATTTKEAKMVYESLSTTLSAVKKAPIRESLGFASKAAGMAPKKQIVESNDVISRMQKLANIIK